MGRLRYIRLTRRQRVRVWAAVVLITVTGLLTAILLHLRPMLVKLATARCSNTVSRIVVAAVNDAVEQGWMEYGRLVSFDKDSDGRVTALRSNMAEFNRLQTAVADDVLERLGQVSASELAVPLGTLTGSPLLAGRGPKLTVKMETMGTAAAAFRDKFTAAGINQTKHQILLDVDVYVTIHLYEGQQRNIRGGDGDRGQRAPDVHLLQHHGG